MIPRIAMVGASIPLTDDDLGRMILALENGLPRCLKDIDIINLHNGRDFLTEDKEYDTVIVHSIFYSSRTIGYLCPAKGHPAQTSPYHTLENWKKRLESTKAKTIIVIEGIVCSLSGWNLRDLDGYSMVKRDALITVYRRKS